VVGGVLYLEHEPEHAVDINERGAKAGFKVKTFKDQYGILRFTRLCRINA
jgi:hypothetical protein